MTIIAALPTFGIVIRQRLAPDFLATPKLLGFPRLLVNYTILA